nr:MAG TPA: RecT protein [Caudoviricetes sp.]
MTNAIAKAKEAKLDKPQKTLRDYIKSMEGEIKKALPSVLTPERFTRMMLSAVSNTPKLPECTPKSFLAAMMSAAQLGLEPNTPLGQAYLIPFKNKGVLEVQFQVGYKGLIDLAYRSGEVDIIQAQAVHENDEWECEFGIEPKLRHVPADTNRGEVVRYYAMFRTKTGGYGFEVMSVDDIKAHAQKYSQSFNSSFSPWKSNFDAMAKKTVLKQCLKYAPMKSDFVKAIANDETIKHELSEDMYSVTDETVYEDAIEAEAEVVSEEFETGEMKDNEKDA